MFRTLVALLAGSAVAMALVGPASAAPASVVPPGEVVLPAPTGPHLVGAARLHLVDQDRTDPWVPTRPRELMVSVTYPAAAARGERVPYATAEESRLLLHAYGFTNLAPDSLTRVGTHARAGAPPRPGRFPLIVLSPGLAFPRYTLTTLAEDLASRGYVVVSVDHTYEGTGITFPDGRVTTCLVCNGRENTETVATSRVKDISFVLDRVLADNRYRPMINPHRIMVGGHSLGGTASAKTILTDRRVDAGFNLDGATAAPLFTQDLTRPFLLLSAEDRHPGNFCQWDQGWPHLTGWRRWLYLPDVGHAFLSDIAVIIDGLDLPPQPLPGTRVIQILRTYLAAFADLHLRHHPQRLLNGPSPRFPEVHFVDPTR
jgi:dienelactone hydrolase